jgi:hypothetical protein
MADIKEMSRKMMPNAGRLPRRADRLLISPGTSTFSLRVGSVRAVACNRLLAHSRARRHVRSHPHSRPACNGLIFPRHRSQSPDRQIPERRQRLTDVPGHVVKYISAKKCNHETSHCHCPALSLAAIGQHHNGSDCHAMTVIDARLQRLMRVWDALPEEVKQVIETLCS